MQQEQTGWAIKVPLGDTELYVTENEKVKLFATKEQAQAEAKTWKRYRVVYFLGHVD